MEVNHDEGRRNSLNLHIYNRLCACVRVPVVPPTGRGLADEGSSSA